MRISPEEGQLSGTRSAGLGRNLPLKLFYGIGSIPFGVKDNGFQVLLLLFYNQALGLDAGLVGIAILIALVVDAFVDPTIGYLSDRVRSRWGRRHPFMYAAALPASFSYLLLFVPPAGLGQTLLFSYLLVTAILARICVSFYEIPSSALAPELTSNYDERTSFIGFRYFFGWVGGLGMSVLAFSVFLHFSGASLSRLGFRHYGMAAALIMIVATLVSAFGTQAAVRPMKDQLYENAPHLNIVAEMRSTLGNRSAMASVIAGVLMLLATGLSFALGTYFNIYAWGLTPAQISILTAGLFLSAALAILISPLLARRFDKRGAAIRVSAVLFIILPLPLEMSLLGLLPSMASGWLMPFLFIYNLGVTTLLISVPILLASMLSDVVEEIEVDTGARNEGVIFAINTFMAKWATGLAVFLSTVILHFAGFPAHASAGGVSAAVIHRLSTIYVVVVMLLYAGSMISAYFYLITRKQHAENLDLLARRKKSDAVSLRL